MEVNVFFAGLQHLQYAETISAMMQDAAKIRGTGIALRSPEYLEQKMKDGKATIALSGDLVAGFCYIESWSDQRYVAHSGLIVHPDFRNTGLAKKIKLKTFKLSQQRFPGASIFGITTSLAVMKINSELGYKPVTFSELTDDEEFWNGCKSCVNYDILIRTNHAHCLCTGMLCKPDANPVSKNEKIKRKQWENFKRFLKLRRIRISRRLAKAENQGTVKKNKKFSIK